MTPVAAVDVGTNSVRLLIGRPDGAGGLDPMVRLMRITRLGQGVDATRRLAEEALARTREVLREYAAAWRAAGVGRVRVAATSAVRDAANRDAFFAMVADVTGVEAEVLSGAEEAALSFAGAVGAVDAEPPVLVLDIGGGSTELIRGDDAPIAATSRQLGSVRVTERALRSDPPTAAEIAAARAMIAAELDAAAAEVDPAAARTLVGVAGTVTTLAALHLDLATYEPERVHGSRVPAAGVTALTERLLTIPTAARAALGPVQPGREDVIHAGALILEAVLTRFGFAEVVVSEADILDGLARSLLA